ncbi:unnamed protein product [Arabis nemorensis]|uniref:Uncharacterized protein n=1 Tax=Arabis nemorensis TaxID=586526 RepID=A0A565BDE6_9BRAS|nr:unnamed protein product [Arabis nemorensis]
MAYVDHAFSISDEDLMIGTSYTVSNRPPVKEISLAVALLVFGTLGIVSGFFMAYNRVGGDRGHGMIVSNFRSLVRFLKKPSLGDLGNFEGRFREYFEETVSGIQ